MWHSLCGDRVASPSSHCSVGTSMTVLELCSDLGRSESALMRATRRTRGTQESGNCEFHCARDLTRIRGKPRHIDRPKRTRGCPWVHLDGIERVGRFSSQPPGRGGTTADGGRGEGLDRAVADRCCWYRPAVHRCQGADQGGPRATEAEAG